jgi:serine/threonine protein kinase
MALPEGTVLKDGRYQIEKLLAYGGFGFTYLAQDRLARRRVVLKELIPALANQTDAARRFVREGRTMQRLRHPNIAGTEAMFRERGNHYMVVEYVPGVPLSDWTDREQKMSLSQAAPIILALCDAVGYLHQRGIIHCDLNASNVLLDPQGQPKLVDLGIAHVSDDFVHRAWQTQRSFAMGTILCMAPEQLDGARGDPRVDLYALATLLYQLLAGRPYLDFDTRQTPSAQAENIRRVRSEAPRPISGIPPAVMAVLLVALAKDPDDRYPDVGTFRRELTQALLAHLPSHTGIGLLTSARTGYAARGRVQSKTQSQSTQPFEWPPWIWGVLVAINVVVMVLVGFLLIV